MAAPLIATVWAVGVGAVFEGVTEPPDEAGAAVLPPVACCGAAVPEPVDALGVEAAL
jgi:hypothetical protein